MASLTDLSLGELRQMGDAVETLIEFRDYLPRGGMLLMLAGKFRDHIRELLGMPSLGRLSRGPERKALTGLADADLVRLSKALVVLCPECASYVDDPEMNRLLAEAFDEVTVTIADGHPVHNPSPEREPDYSWGRG
jgi:hypothetical protein